MDDKCKKYWHPGAPCPVAPSLPSGTGCLPLVSPTLMPSEGRGSIAFGGTVAPERPVAGIPLPRFDIPGPMMKTVRDPALSLIALSGVDPSGPVMVEVPLVLNNTAFAPTQGLMGWRIGFVARYVSEHASEPVEHGATFTRALDMLRQAGAQLVAVAARRPDKTLQFSVQSRQEIDIHVTEQRLDAVVCEGESPAFQGACSLGYPGVCEPLEDGTRLWFYSARGTNERLAVLMRHVGQLLREKTAPRPTPGEER